MRILTETSLYGLLPCEIVILLSCFRCSFIACDLWISLCSSLAYHRVSNIKMTSIRTKIEMTANVDRSSNKERKKEKQSNNPPLTLMFCTIREILIVVLLVFHRIFYFFFFALFWALSLFSLQFYFQRIESTRWLWRQWQASNMQRNTFNMSMFLKCFKMHRCFMFLLFRI